MPDQSEYIRQGYSPETAKKLAERDLPHAHVSEKERLTGAKLYAIYDFDTGAYDVEAERDVPRLFTSKYGANVSLTRREIRNINLKIVSVKLVQIEDEE